jgi:hypothetical protein
MPITQTMHVKKPTGKDETSDVVVVTRAGRRLRLPPVIHVKPKNQPDPETAKPDVKNPDGSKATTQSIEAKKPDGTRDDAQITTKDPGGKSSGIRLPPLGGGVGTLLPIFWTDDIGTSLGWLEISGTTYRVTGDLTAVYNAYPNCVSLNNGIVLYQDGQTIRKLTKTSDELAFAFPVTPEVGYNADISQIFQARDGSGAYITFGYPTPDLGGSWGPLYWAKEFYWVPVSTLIPQRLGLPFLYWNPPAGGPPGYVLDFDSVGDLQVGSAGLYVLGSCLEYYLPDHSGMAAGSVLLASMASPTDDWSVSKIFTGTPANLFGNPWSGYSYWGVGDWSWGALADAGALFGLKHTWFPDAYPIPGLQQNFFIRYQSGSSYLETLAQVSSDSMQDHFAPLWSKGSDRLYYQGQDYSTAVIKYNGSEVSTPSPVTIGELTVVFDDTANSGYLYFNPQGYDLWRWRPGDASMTLMTRSA